MEMCNKHQGSLSHGQREGAVAVAVAAAAGYWCVVCWSGLGRERGIGTEGKRTGFS